jgi:hypothetical protein
MSMKIGILALAAIAESLGSAGLPEGNSFIPRPSVDHSKPATLTRKAWKKRKRRLTLTKASRRANR